MKEHHVTFLLLLTIFISMCTDPIEVIPPTFVIEEQEFQKLTEQVCGEEQEVIVISEEQPITLIFSAEDNESLSQAKIDIHHNFDCHGHGGSAQLFEIPIPEKATEDWALLKIIELDGKVIEGMKLEYFPPHNVTAGSYHIQFSILDEAGNISSSTFIRTMYVHNNQDTIAPNIDVLTAINSSWSLKRGDKYSIQGILKDNRTLGKGGNSLVYLLLKSIATENVYYLEAYQTFTGSLKLEERFDIEFSTPKSLSPGNYELIIQGFDGVRNQNQKSIQLVLT